jgi:hypothetical protein
MKRICRVNVTVEVGSSTALQRDCRTNLSTPNRSELSPDLVSELETVMKVFSAVLATSRSTTAPGSSERLGRMGPIQTSL